MDNDIITDSLAGRSTRVLASGTTVVLDDTGRVDGRLVCGEIVPVWTEDGPATGRCRRPVLHDDIACPGHADEIRGWRSMTEPERVAWERAAWRHREEMV